MRAAAHVATSSWVVPPSVPGATGVRQATGIVTYPVSAASSQCSGSTSRIPEVVLAGLAATLSMQASRRPWHSRLNRHFAATSAVGSDSDLRAFLLGQSQDSVVEKDTASQSDEPSKAVDSVVEKDTAGQSDEPSKAVDSVVEKDTAGRFRFKSDEPSKAVDSVVEKDEAGRFRFKSDAPGKAADSVVEEDSVLEKDKAGRFRFKSDAPGKAAATPTTTAATSSSDVPDRSGTIKKHHRPLVTFVIGGPGSGKGTQCELVKSKLDFIHLSAGELLREERKREGSPLKKIIEDVIKEGKTVPSEIIAQLLEQAMRDAGGWQPDAPAAKFVIDGYPRSEEQLAGWTEVLSHKVEFACCLNLSVSDEEMKRRLLGRAETSGRLDDNAETIVKRFKTFEEETGPLLRYFEEQGKLRVVDGGRNPEDVFQDVKTCVEEATKEILM